MKKSAAVLCIILVSALTLSLGCATNRRVETVITTTSENGVTTVTKETFVTEEVVYPDPDHYYYVAGGVTHRVYFGVDTVWVRPVPIDHVVLNYYWRPTPYYRSHFHRSPGHHYGHVDVNVGIHGVLINHHQPRSYSSPPRREPPRHGQPFHVSPPRREPPRQQTPHGGSGINHSVTPSRQPSHVSPSRQPSHVSPSRQSSPARAVTPARPMRSTPQTVRPVTPRQQYSNPNTHSPSLRQTPSRQPSHVSPSRQSSPARAVTPARPTTRSTSPIRSPQRNAPARAAVPTRSSRPTPNVSPARSSQRSTSVNRSKPARPMNNGKHSNGRNQ
ncbi:MAG: hypothetical protein WC668_00585 [Patescibacteria group bacterium]